MATINPTSLGGGIQGISARQTVLNYKDSEQTSTRTILRNSWNTPYATGQFQNRNRVLTPFRAVNNAGDFLCRVNYQCGGSTQINTASPGMVGAHRNGNRGLSGLGNARPSVCDGTNVPAFCGNPKYVYDSSDYIRFRRQQALNQNYNDSKNGGDQSNGSYVARMHVRRFF
jgi:hypothetical protein